ncbi:MAG: D-alanine--D-alanine ligase [Bacteroidetes bacterium]|nr:MAG: D-alanine--D-alanine ligase [Bacteroidota bacterium]
MKEKDGKAIAILTGGLSGERPISLASAKQVEEWLAQAGYNPYIIDIRGFQWTYTDGTGRQYQFDASSFTLPLADGRIDFCAAMIAIHGDPGENGVLQGYLQMQGIPFTTGDVLAQSLSFHKGACKQFLQGIVPMAPSIETDCLSKIDAQAIDEKLGYPLFVKPNDNGSSVGVQKVKAKDQLLPAVNQALANANSIIIERALEGIEVSCGMVQLNGKDTVFPITQLIAPAEFFDYQSKYDGSTQEITPAPIAANTAEQIANYTKAIYHRLNLKGIARADYIIQDDTPYFLEINTVPGMTSESILPQQVAAHGWTMEDLLLQLIEEAIARG